MALAPPAAAHLGEGASWEVPGEASRIAASPDGLIYLDASRSVLVHSRDGVPLGEIAATPDGPLGTVRGMAASRDSLYVLHGRRIERYARDGTHLGSFTTNRADDPDPGFRPLPDPHSLALDPAGNVAVIEREMVKRFTPDGAPVSVQNVGLGPSDIAFGADGTLFVARFAFGYIESFDPAGNLRRRFGRKINQMSRFAPGRDTFTDGWSPHGVAVDAAGRIWADDLYFDRIQGFGPGGEFLTSCGIERVERSGDVAASADGAIFVLGYKAGANRPARVVRIEEVGPPTPRCDATAPLLTRPAVTSRVRLTRSRSLPRRAVLRGRIGEAAAVSVLLIRTRCRRRCRTGTRRPARAREGRVRLRLRNLIGRRRLAPGLYRARVTVADVAGNRARVTTGRFRVLPPR